MEHEITEHRLEPGGRGLLLDIGGVVVDTGPGGRVAATAPGVFR